jgi:hypothetical protein
MNNFAEVEKLHLNCRILCNACSEKMRANLRGFGSSGEQQAKLCMFIHGRPLSASAIVQSAMKEEGLTELNPMEQWLFRENIDNLCSPICWHPFELDICLLCKYFVKSDHAELILLGLEWLTALK